MPNKSPKQKNNTSDNQDIKGFDIKINEFGEVICSHTMNDLNKFLDANVDDKKLSSNKLAQKADKGNK